MEETKTIWYSGKFVPWNSATTHVLTHALNYGTGIFEGIRCYPHGKGGVLFRLGEHVDRFFDSAAPLGMKIPFSKKELAAAIIETVRRNKVYDVYVRPLGFFGYQKLGPNPADSPVEVSIACVPLKNYLKNEWTRVKLARLERISPKSCYPHSKITGMYFNAALASLEAWKAGYDEAIVLDYKGYVAEGAAENLFVVKNGVLYTPPEDTILPGITRETIMLLCKDLKIPCKEKRISLKFLENADEAFFSGTAVEIHALGEIDTKMLPRTNPITKKIQAYYQAVVRGEVPKYRTFLTFV